MLWNRNFTLLAAANVFFHAAVYMQFPLLHRWMTEVWGYTGVEAACMAVVFGLSLFVPGVFNSYLVDTFSRKKVCVWSMIVLGLATVSYSWVSATWQIIALRILQGGAFGIALMATGSTLAIDVASSHQRDRANRAFTWSGIIGMLAGVCAGLAGMQHLTFMQSVSVSAWLLITAITLIGYVKVSFRAPLDLPLCSFDRFLLFRALHGAWISALFIGERDCEAFCGRADSGRYRAGIANCRIGGLALPYGCLSFLGKRCFDWFRYRLFHWPVPSADDFASVALRAGDGVSYLSLVVGVGVGMRHTVRRIFAGARWGFVLDRIADNRGRAFAVSGIYQS